MRSIAIVIVATVATGAAADPKQADRESAEADALVAAGEFARAAIKFRSAYAQDSRPSLICNAGVAYYKAKDLPRAHYYLGRCLKLRDQLDATFVGSLTKAIAAVTSKLESTHYPRIELAPEPTDAVITVDGATSPFDEPVVAGVVWVPPGHYRLTFRAPGHTDKSQTVDVRADQTITENVQLAATASSAPPSIDTKPEEPRDPKSVIVTPQPPEEPRPRSRTPAVVASIATGVVGVIAIASYTYASHEATVAGSATTPSDYDAAKDSALSYQHASWIFGGLAGAGAIASGVLWYLAVRAPSIEVHATGSGAAVSISGRF